MSRYTIECTQEGIEIVVGWDRPLGSLFAQVSDRRISDDESDPMLLWEDFKTTEALARAIAPWAELPNEIREKLAVESGEKPPARVPAFERPERVVFADTRCRVCRFTHNSAFWNHISPSNLVRVRVIHRFGCRLIRDVGSIFLR